MSVRFVRVDEWMDSFISDSIHSTRITIVQMYQHIDNRHHHCTSSSLVLQTGQTMGQIESLGQVVPSSIIEK